MANILIIEDEQDIREKIQQILRYEGFDTLTAENGRIGVQMARQHAPDLIICDVLMPELNGYGVLTDLRSDPRTAAIPFIFLTAKATAADVRRGMSLGADDYLAKPFKVPDLLDTIRVRLEKRAAASKQLEDLRFELSRTLPHELQTPLTAILGFTEFLLNIDRSLLPDIDDILEMQRGIHDSAVRLQHLIENYLLYARLRLLEEHPGQQNPPAEIITNDAATLISYEARQRARAWQRETDVGLQVQEVVLSINGPDLQKIVDEVMDNACKFSQSGAPITVIAAREGDRYELRVSDHGRGMTVEQIAQIGAFKQFDRQLYEQQGAGLGLTIVRLLLRLYDGRFRIESEPGQGTTVTMSLPVVVNQ